MMPASITFSLHFQASTFMFSRMGELSYKYPHYFLLDYN